MLKDVLNPDNEDFGFTKVCISKRRTKLNYDIWCDSLGRERDKNIQPFIMICNTVADKDRMGKFQINHREHNYTTLFFHHTHHYLYQRKISLTLK